MLTIRLSGLGNCKNSRYFFKTTRVVVVVYRETVLIYTRLVFVFGKKYKIFYVCLQCREHANRVVRSGCGRRRSMSGGRENIF